MSENEQVKSVNSLYALLLRATLLTAKMASSRVESTIECDHLGL